MTISNMANILELDLKLFVINAVLLPIAYGENKIHFFKTYMRSYLLPPVTGGGTSRKTGSGASKSLKVIQESHIHTYY